MNSGDLKALIRTQANSVDPWGNQSTFFLLPFTNPPGVGGMPSFDYLLAGALLACCYFKLGCRVPCLRHTPWGECFDFLVSHRVGQATHATPKTCGRASARRAQGWTALCPCPWRERGRERERGEFFCPKPCRKRERERERTCRHANSAHGTCKTSACGRTLFLPRSLDVLCVYGTVPHAGEIRSTTLQSFKQGVSSHALKCC